MTAPAVADDSTFGIVRAASPLHRTWHAFEVDRRDVAVNVATIIKDRRLAILDRWLDQVGHVTSARGLTRPTLANMMPSYLDALGGPRALEAIDDDRDKYVRLHLSSRIHQGFDLIEIVDEFGILGRCIAEEWETLPDAELPDAHDIDALNEDLRVAVSVVTDTFYHHMLEDEQTEKRYFAALQRIATEALHEPGAPLSGRLREVLAIVMESMSAQCAAFLAYDVRESKLVLIACAGLDAPEIYATALGLDSFASQIAGRDTPTSIVDLTSTVVEVPAGLRENGIHALLGVRLPPRYDLLGVMYVGIAEARPFTTREIGRIEALAERLGLHLENARMFGDLRDTIATLTVEQSLRERFVSMLAHDLRGPLTSAKLASELLSLRSDRHQELTHRIEQNLERIDRMVCDLLDANRIRANEPLPLELAPCDIVSLVTEIVDEVRAIHGNRFELVTPPRVLGIWSSSELRRAAWNLLGNAVKYGAQGTVRIVVDTDDGHVRLSVHNYGNPIPSDELAHIFDAYARANTKRKHVGWGLGLTLVRGCAEAHGGYVEVHSDARRGTTFTIVLPRDARRPTSVQPRI